jgi:hypothetical protein
VSLTDTLHFLKITPNKTTLSIIIKSGGILQNDYVQLPVILRIFDENHNPVDMHTSIMCINIRQYFKAVGGVGRTNHVPFIDSDLLHRGASIDSDLLHRGSVPCSSK